MPTEISSVMPYQPLQGTIPSPRPELIEAGCYELDHDANILFADSQAVDWLGCRKADLFGKNLWTIFPAAVHTEIYKAIQTTALEGRQRVQIEFSSPLLTTRVALLVLPTANGCVADFTRVPERAADIQHELEERRSYLLKLSDALRPLSDPVDIKSTACRMLGEQVNVSRVSYGEVIDERLLVLSQNFIDGIPPVIGTLTPDEIGQSTVAAYKRNEKVIFSDIRTDLRYSSLERKNLESRKVVASASLGLIKEGRWVAAFGMHHHTPREWSAIEISLLEETAERTWAAVERARAEEALRESEERLQLSLKCAHIFTWEVNSATGETRYSDNCDEVLGFKIEKISSDNFITIYPEDMAAVLAAMDSAIKGKEPLDIEHRVIHPQTKAIIWIRAQGQLVRRRGFEKPVLIGITQNVTARKNAEEALRQSDALLSSVFSILPVGVGIMDTAGNIIAHNEEMRRFLTFTEDGATLSPHDQLEMPTSEDIVGIPEMEMPYAVPNGQPIWTRVSCIPLRNNEHEITGAVIVITDIDELKRTAEALQAHERRLTELVKVRDEFIGVASHELKTPVTSLKAYAQIMQRRLEEIGDTQDNFVLTRLNVQIDRLTTLINHLLDTTRISQGQLTLTFEKVNIGKLLQERVEEIRLTTTHRFVIEWDTISLVMADQERIGQVITNLLSNAVKYSPPASTVRIAAQQRENEMEISIHDEGYGIPEEHQAKIFERFFRSSTPNTAGIPGMGLGLYIAAQIIERHGGRMWVESIPGKGSGFFFTLPSESQS